MRFGLRFGLLGPPVLYDDVPGGAGSGATAGSRRGDGAARAIGSPKTRVLLAALLLDAGRVVSVESLKDALWGGAPPVSAQASLHNHVARLRRLLDDPERLRTVPSGYVLRVDEGELDVHVFDAHVTAARAAHTGRDWQRVVAECGAALALWRGAPLAGLPPEVGGYAFARRLREARLLLLEWRHDAELALGGPRLHELVPELAALASEYPLREVYHRQLMLALHRTGRRAEALAVHRDLRTRLLDELGIEPGPGVREAHVEVLRGSFTDAGSTEPPTRPLRSPEGVGSGGEGSRSSEGVGSESGGPRPSEGAGSGEFGSRPSVYGVDVGSGEWGLGSSVGAGGSGSRSSGGAGSGEFGSRLSVDGVDVGSGEWGLGSSVGAGGSGSRPSGGAGSGERGSRPSVDAVDVGSGKWRHGSSVGPGGPGSQLSEGAGPEERGSRPSPGAGPGERGSRPSADADPGGLGSRPSVGSDPGERDSRPSVGPASGKRGSPSPGGVGPSGPGSRQTARMDPGAPGSQRSAAPSPSIPAPQPPPSTTPANHRSGEPTPDPAPAPASAPRPAQLPPPPAHFTGRAAVRDALSRALTAPGPHPTAVISGMPGVGKSALALHVAHAVAERFPDGQLHLDLHGATPGMTPLAPGQALTALLRDLGVEPGRIPELPDAAAALLRSLLAPTRTLLVLDDAASAAQVRPLLPGGAGCAVIVTSRSPLTALDGAARFPLAPLSDEESADLLRAASGRDGLDGSDAARRLVELTGRLPLALRVVAARLAARPALTPDVLAVQLTAADGRLGHLEYDDLSVRRSLAVAQDALAASEREADRDAALTLRRIGALDLPTYGAPLLARLTGTGERRTEAALDRLVDVALLEETAYGRYAPHDLVRDFARERAGEREADAADAALRWYAAVAERALAAILGPGPDQDDRRRPTADRPTGHPAHTDEVAPFDTPEEAFAWGDRELANIVTLAERHGDDPCGRRAALVSVLVRLVFPYAHRRGRVAEMEVLGRVGLRVARRLGDEAAEAYALVDLAGLHFLTGRHSDALTLNDRALDLWRRLDHPSWIRRCLNNRGLLLEGLGRHTEAGEALTRSLEYARRLDDPYGEAVTHSHLGNLYEHTDPRAAIEQHRRSLALGEEIGAVILRHSAHCNIGYAHLRLGEPAAALPHFEESLRILGGQGDWHGESQTRLGLVRALRLLGRTGRAAHECAELLGRAEARADRYTGGLARHQHGLLLRERGRPGEAREEWGRALAALEGTDEHAVVAELRALLAPEG
ncbi:AfsR/SARP family transcriptional regulator [Streptomyces olindensis]|uniref:AfsR/SARP family transcriptional regulator n=1 Tax=Streptomyces olindensis TaxID=358823 RepID=UPI0033CB7E4C